MSNKLKQIIQGTVENINREGNGVINRPIGKPYLVYHTIPDEEVVICTRYKSREGIHAELQKVIKPSPHRTEPRCPLFGKCGGCKWQHVDYPYQLTIKLDLIKKTFTEKNIQLPLAEVTPGSDQFFYRNRMDFMFGKNGELGLKEAGCWWSVIDLPACYLLSEKSNEILLQIQKWSRESGLPFWNNKKHEGFFRALVIREGKNTGERLVMLVTNKDTAQKTKKVISSLPDRLADLATSVVWGINERVTDLSLADEITILKGTPYLHEEINGLKYRISPNSFFQTNSEMAAKLQNTVLEFANPTGKNIADLYCGAGFFTLALARAGAKQIIGIEADEAGIEAAKQNAELNKIPAEFIAAKIEDYFKDQLVATGFDVVILDPPRAGLHPKVIETLLKTLPSQIIYVSCNYARLATELSQFLEYYELTEARAFDLFPQTPHVEVVIKLEKI